MRTFRAAVADCLTHGNGHASQDLAFALGSHGSDLDPLVESIALRASRFRHAVAVDQRAREDLQEIYELYAEKQQRGGIYTGQEELQRLRPAPMPGEPGRQQWRGDCDPCGPVGFLLEALHMAGAALTPQWKVVKDKHPPADILAGPVQALKPTIRDMAAAARTEVAEGMRDITRNLGRIDKVVSNQGVEKRGSRERNFLNCIRMGAAIANQARYHMGASDTQ